MKQQYKRILYTSAPGFRIVDILSYEVRPDGTCRLEVILERDEPEPKIEDSHLFKLVDPKAIKIEEYFRNYEPRSFYSKAFKDNLMRALENNVDKFYCPIYAPSAAGDKICFVKDANPAVGQTFNWWLNAAKNYNPDHRSRIGTKNEYVLYLAFIINQLIESGWDVDRAWSVVCNDSKEIGNFLTRGPMMEKTGSHEVVGFYDLGNVCRIVLTDKDAGYCWIAGGSYKTASFINPLANLDYYRINSLPFEDAVGWVIYDA